MPVKLFNTGHTSGVDILSGQFNVEYNRNMRGAKKWETLEKMESDPHVKSGLNIKMLPLLAADWEIVPASDEPRDIEIAEFVAANLLRRSGEKYGREYWTQTPWQQRLFEILDMLRAGHSLFAKTWRRVGTKRVLHRIQWIEPESIDDYGWMLDERDNITGFKRCYRRPDGRYVYNEILDAKDTALYVWELKGARFEGRPAIRSMYGPWFRKDIVQRLATIWAQKVGAPIPVGTYPHDWPQEVINDFENTIMAMRGQSPAWAYAMLPQNADGKEPTLKYVGAETGEVDRMAGLVQSENSEIAHAAGNKANMAGENTFGSRSTAEVQSMLDMLGPQAVAEIVCEFETHGVGNLPGLIEELVDANFAGVRGYPRLAASRVDPGEKLKTLPELLKAVNAGIVPATPDLKRQVTERLGYELPDEAFEPKEAQIAADLIQRAFIEAGALRRDDLRRAVGLEPVGGELGEEFVTIGQNKMPQGDDSAPPSASTPPPEDSPNANEEDDDTSPNPDEDGQPGGGNLSLEGDIRTRLADLLQPVEDAPLGGGFRRPTVLEARYVALEAVQEAFRVGERDIVAALRRGHRDMLAELKRRGRAGKLDPKRITGGARPKYRGKAKLMGALLDPIRDTGGKGAQHVADELARQQSQPMRAGLEAIEETTVAGVNISDTLVRAFDDVAETLAELDIGKMWDRVLGEYLGEYARLQREGKAGDSLFRALDAFIDGLSEKPVEDLGRQSAGVAYNQGRDAGLRTALDADAARYAVRSEILDANTCSSCQTLDGYVAEIGSEQYAEFLPPAKCLGRDRCRGFYVVISDELVEAA